MMQQAPSALKLFTRAQLLRLIKSNGAEERCQAVHAPRPDVHANALRPRRLFEPCCPERCV